MKAVFLLILAALTACASETPEAPEEPVSATATAPAGAKRFDLQSPVGEIDRPPSEMRWSVGPGLMACRVIIVTERNQSVWTSSPSDEGVAQVPEEIQGRFQPGESYFWKVVCSFSGLQIGSDFAKITFRQL